jgi:hypothetical protein
VLERLVRPFLTALILLLLAPVAAQARVVVVATQTNDAYLLDTRSDHPFAPVALPGRTRAV